VRVTALTILAVESDPPLRDMYDALLAQRGHRVRKARTGREALEHLGPDIDVVVVDLRSHKSEGRTVLEALSREAVDHRPAIVIVDGDDESSALVTGPRTVVLRKPFDFERFVQAVEAMAQIRRPKRN
jgi:DNA-binding response OmpR family regulator